MGIGDVAWMTAQMEDAPTVCLVMPFNIPANHVGMLLLICTRTKGEEATLEGGRFKFVRPTLEAPGKSTYTLLPSVPEFAAPWPIELLNPLSAAYEQGEGVGLAMLQSKALPGVKCAVDGIEPLVAPTSISIAAAVQAASEAV